MKRLTFPLSFEAHGPLVIVTMTTTTSIRADTQLTLGHMSSSILAINMTSRLISRKNLPGHVTIGGSVCMEMLTKSGWRPTNDIEVSHPPAPQEYGSTAVERCAKLSVDYQGQKTLLRRRLDTLCNTWSSSSLSWSHSFKCQMPSYGGVETWVFQRIII